MQNSLEIQILSPATREQLIELRNEIRKIEGMEGFELEIPLPAQKPGTMSGALAVEITMGLIAGVTHYTSEKTFEYLVTRVGEVIKKTFKHKAGTEKIMGAAEKKDWEVIVSGGSNGTKNNIYLNSEGNKKDFSNRQYSINPDKTYALLIGVATYDDEAHFAPIPPVERNLDDMYGVLNDKRIIGLPIKNINLVFNETNAVIRKELGKLAQLSDIETLIIYFAGHGQNDGNNKLTLIAKDTYTDDEELCYDIPYAFIEQKINRSPAAQKIILIDACNSGLATQSGVPKPDFEPVKGSFILASTSADKASYYNTEEKNTRFTHYLLDVFNNGIANAKAMLSLDDLYNYTKDKLTAKKLPSPTCKSELENIITDKFYISKNPAFLLGDKLTEIDQLYRDGAYDEARKEYRSLLKEYPDDTQVTRAYSNFDINMQYIMLVNEANSLFYNQKDYVAAKNKYAEAYEIKEEETIKTQIRECGLLLNKDRADTGDSLKWVEDRPIPVMLKDDIVLPRTDLKNDKAVKPVAKLSRNKIKIIVAGFLATVFTAVILSVFTHKETPVPFSLTDNKDTVALTPVPAPPPDKPASTLNRQDSIVKARPAEKFIDATALQDSIFRVDDTTIKKGNVKSHRPVTP